MTLQQKKCILTTFQNIGKRKRWIVKRITVVLFLVAAVALSAASCGTLCLTFDDRFFDSWLDSDKFFKQYDARVTFFISGKIDGQAVAAMKKLQDAGHSIGLHALNHAKFPSFAQKYGVAAYTEKQIIPQLEVCRKNNIRIRAFAYPYSQRTPESDRELFKTFDFLRTNCTDVKKHDIPLEKADGCFVKKVLKKQLFYGFPASGNFNLQEVKNAMKRASEEDAVIVFYAHNIKRGPSKSHHVSYKQLKEILEYAKSLGMALCGMNEL